MLGAKEERRITIKDGVPLIQMRVGASLIDLTGRALLAAEAATSSAWSAGRNMDHFAVRIEPWNEEAIRAHLISCNVDVVESGRRYGAEGQGPSIYIIDCEGNNVELKGPAEPGTSLRK